MTQDQKAEIFQQFQPMVTSLAKKLARGNQARFQELCVEGASKLGLAIAEWAGDNDRCSASFRGTRTARSTWCYHILYWAMLTHIRKMDRHPVVSAEECGEAGRELRAKQTPWLQRVFSDLGEDARTIVSLIVMAPVELMDEMRVATARRARTAVWTYLSQQYDWDEERIESAWSEVAAELGS